MLLTSVSHDLTLSSSGLSVLTTDLVTPVVSETSVGSDLLESLNIVSELDIKLVDKELRVLAVSEVSLSVKEPAGDLVLAGVLDDGNNSLELLDGELTGSLGEIDISLLADKVGVSSTNTLDLAHGVHDLDSAVNVSVEESVLVSCSWTKWPRPACTASPECVLGMLFGSLSCWFKLSLLGPSVKGPPEMTRPSSFQILWPVVSVSFASAVVVHTEECAGSFRIQ